MTNKQFTSLEEITRAGEKFYLEELKDKIEEKYMGQYVVIDVEEKKYQIDSDRLVAVDKARREYGDKLFYIVQIGNNQSSNVNFKEKKYAWNF